MRDHVEERQVGVVRLGGVAHGRHGVLGRGRAATRALGEGLGDCRDLDGLVVGIDGRALGGGVGASGRSRLALAGPAFLVVLVGYVFDVAPDFAQAMNTTARL